MGMEVKLLYTPNGITTLEGALKMGQDMARQCYSGKDPLEVMAEPYDAKLTEGRILKGGHLSVFDHFNITTNFGGIPKAMAMVLNNEPPYTTSEKSARYTKMKGMDSRQKAIYDKWMGILAPEIEKVLAGPNDRDVRAMKLAQENARYMTSVFTPTSMNYTHSLRHQNELAHKFEDFIEEARRSGDPFMLRLAEEGMVPFLESEVVQRFRAPDIKHKMDEGVLLFGDAVEETFSPDVYATNHPMSFACLAQTHRHRTIHNHISDGLQQGGNPSLGVQGFFVPPIVEHIGLTDEWLADLAEVAAYDFPQGQMLMVAERGNTEHLAAKADERLCGHAQLEIMRGTRALVKKYQREVPGVELVAQTPCSSAPCSRGTCTTGKKSLERII
ncbi:MAG: FAD-dependent thymidylate synthase [archaeon]|nr:FAD-dependent thymidylate synthase [archaeon]MCR4323780.1 FAD-dependent thymidylate synthase [Nanoarchaeota archaeon]